MRILHTADWHVGRTIRGRSRADEHRAVLGQIAGIARDREVDLVLLAGDVFDTAAPSAESEQIVYQALLDLAATGAQVVVVAGNHDHPERLQAVRPLLHASRIHVGARLARPDEGGVLRLDTASGQVAQVALLPFLSQRAIIKADALMGHEAGEHAQAYDARARAIIASLCAPFSADTVNLVVAHLMVIGGVMGGGERAAHTIFDYCVSAVAFPATAHYIALGHLHRPQEVAAPAPTWYPGSPLQLDFGEAADRKAVLLVDAAPGQPATVETVQLTAGRRLRTIRGSMAKLESLLDTTGDDHLRVVVEGQATADLADQVRSWFPEAVDVVVEIERAQAVAPRRQLDAPPHELFAGYLEERGAVDPRVIALFDELLERIHAPDSS